MSNMLTDPTKPKLTQIVSIIALLIFLPILLIGAQELVSLVSKASGTPANIVVDTKSLREVLSLDFYHAFAQGGEESTDMIKPVVSEVRTLKPKLICIDHIYDSYNVVGKSGDQINFDWSKLDGAVDSIIATGAKPCLSLSYMPQPIAQNGNIVNPPTNWNDWSYVVQKTIEHYSGKGNRNMNGIYYEVWNEPDLPQFGGWKYYGAKNYITLYQYASNGARNATGVNAFYLGGPVTTGLYQPWIQAIVTSGARLDFFAWHTYANDPLKFSQDQLNITTWLNPYPNYILLPKIITEFGFTGDKSSLYGANYAAAFTAATIRQLLSNGITYALSFELKDGPKQEAGDGWGLITNENNGKKLKPRYYVYSCLDQMAGQRVLLTGEGTWVTGFASQKNNTTSVMLVNYDQNGTHTEAVPLTFGNLDPGTYTYSQKYCIGAGTNITTTETASASGIIQKTILMHPSSVAIFKISKTAAANP
ncbi:MAG TPA: hypothetical protein VMR81_03420 [Patescibacteria group bacterium]|nr:hypothetical protein [Patescibacteria group bacterium]